MGGCDRIREAVHRVEILRAHRHPDARVKVDEFGRESSLRVSLRSVEELEAYLDGKMRRMLLASVGAVGTNPKLGGLGMMDYSLVGSCASRRRTKASLRHTVSPAQSS